MAETIVSKTVKQKEKELLKLSDKDLVNRILAFPDREHLNRDEDGKRRKYPSAEMAVRARRSIEKDPEYKISDKQKWAMAHSFAEYSSNELKVSGIKFAKADPNELEKTVLSKEGQKTVYGMNFYLVPEPENEHDKNAVAVYVDRKEAHAPLENGQETDLENKPVRIGYVPASYVATHPIVSTVMVTGTLTDHSSGHFKTISYSMDMDTETICNQFATNNRTDVYTYQMPFILNGDAKEGAAEYMNSRHLTRNGITDNYWVTRLNEELEFYGVNGEIDDIRFEFPGGKAGNILVETKEPLNREAMTICGSYFRYCLESNISADLRREKLVDLSKTTLPAVNTREKMYFSLQSEPAEDDFTKAVNGITETMDTENTL